MSNRGLIIALIILLIIIIILLIAFLGLSLNGKIGLQRWNAKKSSQVIFDNAYEVSQVEHLEILSTAGDIDFKESTDEKVRVVVYGEEEQELKVDLNGNRLKVDYSQYKNKKIFWGFHFYINDIVIYLPKDYGHEINIQAKYGDIAISNLESATIQIEEDCGDVSLGKVKNVFVSNHYGDIQIDEVKNQLSIQSDCGDVEINTVAILENSSVKNNLGDIKIGQTNEIYIEARTSLGDIKVNRNNRHSEVMLKIENECGDIKVEN